MHAKAIMYGMPRDTLQHDCSCQRPAMVSVDKLANHLAIFRNRLMVERSVSQSGVVTGRGCLLRYVSYSNDISCFLHLVVLASSSHFLVPSVHDRL